MRHLSNAQVGFAAVVFALAGLGCPPALHAQSTGYVRIVTPTGALDGGSKDPAHVNWIAVESVVAGDLTGDGMADRESSQPSVSELTVRNMAINHTGSGTTGSGAGKASKDGVSVNSGTGMSKSVIAPRDVASGMATGRRMHKPFVVVKKIDKASPALMEACASGKHIPEVDVDLMSGGQMNHYKLTDVIISGDQKSGGDRPTETISFTYEKIEMK